MPGTEEKGRNKLLRAALCLGGSGAWGRERNQDTEMSQADRLSHRHAYNQGLATGNHGSTSVLSPHTIHSPPLWTKNHQGRLPSLHCPGQPAEVQGWGGSVASVRTPLTRSFSDVNPLQESSALPEVGWVAGRR